MGLCLSHWRLIIVQQVKLMRGIGMEETAELSELKTILSTLTEKEAKVILEQGIRILPEIAMFHHTLGLWYVRNSQKFKGLEALKKAAELDKENAHFQYIYAVAIADKDMIKAIEILEKLLKKHSGHLQSLNALVYYYKQVGNKMATQLYQKKIQEILKIELK